MTEKQGCGASLDHDTSVDDQGTHREAAVARAAMVAVAGGSGRGSGGQDTGARAAKGVRVQPGLGGAMDMAAQGLGAADGGGGSERDRWMEGGGGVGMI